MYVKFRFPPSSIPMANTLLQPANAETHDVLTRVLGVVLKMFGIKKVPILADMLTFTSASASMVIYMFCYRIGGCSLDSSRRSV